MFHLEASEKVRVIYDKNEYQELQPERRSACNSQKPKGLEERVEASRVLIGASNIMTATGKTLHPQYGALATSISDCETNDEG